MAAFVGPGTAGDKNPGTAGNWSPAGVPGAADTATFDKDASQLQGALSVSQFVVTKGTHGNVNVAMKSDTITAGLEIIGNSSGTAKFDLGDAANIVTGP